MHDIWDELKIHNTQFTIHNSTVEKNWNHICVSENFSLEVETVTLPTAIFMEWGDFTRAGKTNAFG